MQSTTRWCTRLTSLLDPTLESPWESPRSLAVDDFGASLGAAVHGRVLSYVWRRPVEGVTVALAGKTVVTDSQGRFTFDRAPPEYELALAGCGGIRMAVFTGITRRNPQLPFEADLAVCQELPNQAQISGTLSGAISFPIPESKSIHIFVVGPGIFDPSYIGGPHRTKGPSFGPLYLHWSGPKTVKVRIIALQGTWNNRASPWDDVFAGSVDVEVRANARSVANVWVAPLAKGLLRGETSRLHQRDRVAVGVDYQWPLLGGSIGLVFEEGSQPYAANFSYQVPALAILGGQFCVWGADHASRSRTRRCGMPLGGRPVKMVMQRAPVFLAPADRAYVHAKTKFTWSPFAGGVHRLHCVDNGILLQRPFAVVPDVDVYTSATSTTWPNLSALNTAFPAGTSYSCSVTGYGPFPSLDVALGPRGLTSLMAESYEAESSSIDVFPVSIPM